MGRSWGCGVCEQRLTEDGFCVKPLYVVGHEVLICVAVKPRKSVSVGVTELAGVDGVRDVDGE